MLSRKLFGSIAVGLLSVALVPVTWARTHTLLHKISAPSQATLSHAPTTKPARLVAPKQTTHALVRRAVRRAPVQHKVLSHTRVSHRVLSHKQTSHTTLSHRSILSKTTSTRLAAHKTPISKTASKLASKCPVKSKVTRHTIAK